MANIQDLKCALDPIGIQGKEQCLKDEGESGERLKWR